MNVINNYSLPADVQADLDALRRDTGEGNAALWQNTAQSPVGVMISPRWYGRARYHGMDLTATWRHVPVDTERYPALARHIAASEEPDAD